MKHILMEHMAGRTTSKGSVGIKQKSEYGARWRGNGCSWASQGSTPVEVSFDWSAQQIPFGHPLKWLQLGHFEFRILCFLLPYRFRLSCDVYIYCARMISKKIISHPWHCGRQKSPWWYDYQMAHITVILNIKIICHFAIQVTLLFTAGIHLQRYLQFQKNMDEMVTVILKFPANIRPHILLPDYQLQVQLRCENPVPKEAGKHHHYMPPQTLLALVLSTSAAQ